MSDPRPIPDLLTITPKAVRKLFADVLKAITGLSEGRVIIETKADRRPPEGLYCSLWFKSMTPLPQNDGDFEYDPDYGIDDPLNQILDNETLCTVQINFWGDDAYDKAAETMQALQSGARFADLWRIIGFAGIDAVQDISTQYGAKIQQRAFFNLDFYVCFGRAYPIDYFNVSQWMISLPEKPYREEWSKGMNNNVLRRIL